jgi:hypothetical protein
MKSQLIPCNRHDHFGVLNRISWPFRSLFFRTKPDRLRARREIELELVDGENELLSMMFYRQ